MLTQLSLHACRDMQGVCQLADVRDKAGDVLVYNNAGSPSSAVTFQRTSLSSPTATVVPVSLQVYAAPAAAGLDSADAHLSELLKLTAGTSVNEPFPDKVRLCFTAFGGAYQDTCLGVHQDSVGQPQLHRSLVCSVSLAQGWTCQTSSLFLLPNDDPVAAEVNENMLCSFVDRFGTYR